MSEQEPVEETIEQETDGQQIDLDALSQEELAKYIDDPEGYEPPVPEDKEEEPETEEEPEAEETVEDTPEPEPEEETESEKEEPEEPEVTEEELRIQELALKAEKAELNAKHYESLLGRKAGEEGYWKRKFEEEQARKAAATEGAYEQTDAVDPGFVSKLEKIEKTQEEILSERIASTIAGTAESFKASHPDRDFTDEAFMKEFSEGVAASGVDLGALYTSNDPKAVASQVEFACKSALIHVKEKENAELKEKLASRSADSSKRMRDKKRAMSASKPPSTKAPPKKVKTPDDMTDAELKAYVDSL